MPLCFSVEIGTNQWNNLTFDAAATRMANHVNAEYQAYKWHLQLNKEQPLVSKASEHLDGARRPTHAEFAKPLGSINHARSYIQRGGREEIAFASLELAALEYEAVHKAWVRYRNSVQQGAQNAITLMKITMLVAAAVPSASATGVVTAAKLAMGLKATEEAATLIGERYHLDEKISVQKLRNSATSIVVSGLFAKFGDMFINKLAERAGAKMVEKSSTWMMGERGVASVLATTGAKPGVRRSFLGFVASFIESSGSDVTTKVINRAINRSSDTTPGALVSPGFWSIVADELASYFQKGAGKAALDAWIKTTLEHVR